MALMPVVPVVFAIGVGELLAAAVIDARLRRFPNALAVAFALTCASLGALGGVDVLARHVLGALCTCALLTAFELRWRRRHEGSAGIGMGDIKFLAAFMLYRPWFALTSFAVGLFLMAAACALRGKRSMPLLPFVAASVPLMGFLFAALIGVVPGAAA